MGLLHSLSRGDRKSIPQLRLAWNTARGAFSALQDLPKAIPIATARIVQSPSGSPGLLRLCERVLELAFISILLSFSFATSHTASKMVDDPNIQLEIVDEVGDIEARDSSVLTPCTAAKACMILADPVHSLSATATLHFMMTTMANRPRSRSLPASINMSICMAVHTMHTMAASTSYR